MPAKPIDAAFILGIVLAVLSLMIFFNGSTVIMDYHKWIINGIIGVMINCILIFGAYTRNSTAILAWIILAILSYIGLVIIGILCIFIVFFDERLIRGHPEKELAMFFSLVFMVGTILFQIWTIIVAKNARKEIDAESSVESAVIQNCVASVTNKDAEPAMV